jgi:thioesterase domain-containing protein/acyl carrier protein
MEVGSAPTETAALTPEIIEAGLVEIWARALGVSALEADDNFFELGGDSVLAVEMLMEVEERFGEEVPLSILISGLTINTLTDQLSSQNGHASLPDGIGTAVVDEKTAKEEELAPVLLPLRAEGSKPPFFLVHGVGLPTLSRPFVENLDPEQPFYIFQHRGLDGKVAPNRTIEAMATDYIAAMREVQPQGPYLLGGGCAGSFVALEMAYQLTRRGEAVPMIFLIDPSIILHAYVGRWFVLRYVRRASAFLWRKLKTGFNIRRAKRRSKFYIEQKLKLRSEFSALTAGGSVKLENVTKAQDSFIRALRKYKPKPYSGVIHFIRPVDPETSYRSVEEFWSKAYDDVRVQPFGRTHREMFGECLPDMAQHLQRCLDAIEG